MYKKQQMDRGIRIMGGCILIYLSFAGGELYSPGKIAAIVVGLYGLLTGSLNFCPLSLFILQEKKIKRGRKAASKTIKIGELKALCFFDDFRDDEIEIVLSHCQLKQYPENHYVVEEGKQQKVFYIIYSGQFKIVKLIPDGGSKIIGTIQDGETFGEQTFFSDLPPSVSVVTLKAAKVLEIDEINFYAMLAKDSDLGIKIVSRIIKIASARMSSLHEQIASLGSMLARGRQHSV
ncbi:MAG: cyclic nucleotide-binding domain-containing protein [Pseudomonadota bacterium]